MTHQTARVLSAQDSFIYRTILIFLTIPLFLLMGAAAIVAG